MSANNWLLRHTSNKLPLDLKLIGHIPKIDLLKVSFGLLLAKKLHQWIHHILHRVYSLYLDELLLEIVAYDIELSLYMLGLLMRLGLLSEGYGTVVVVVQCNDIRWHHIQLYNEPLIPTCFFSSFRVSNLFGFHDRISNEHCLKLFQLTNPPLHRKIHLVVDFLSSISDMKTESMYPSTFNSEPPSKIKNKSLVLLKYLRIFFYCNLVLLI